MMKHQFTLFLTLFAALVTDSHASMLEKADESYSSSFLKRVRGDENIKQRSSQKKARKEKDLQNSLMFHRETPSTLAKKFQSPLTESLEIPLFSILTFHDFLDEELKAHLEVGSKHFHARNYEMAIIELEEVLRFKNVPEIDYGKILNQVGVSYFYTQQYDKAFNNLKSSLALRIASTEDRAATLHNLGITHIAVHQPYEAIPHLRESYIIKKSLGISFESTQAALNTAYGLISPLLTPFSALSSSSLPHSLLQLPHFTPVVELPGMPAHFQAETPFNFGHIVELSNSKIASPSPLFTSCNNDPPQTLIESKEVIAQLTEQVSLLSQENKHLNVQLELSQRQIAILLQDIKATISRKN